ncbi:Dihydrosphingosine phosphate lyase [Salvia divinorum]|uniref:Dihydrosphingosine phosphate lyase n=1 Tax=Salvia divinorum TaxID=28513 RepID=A0ABD1IIP8_SALDI
MQETVASDSSKGVSAQKRFPKKMREIPDSYFLPRRSLSFNLTFFGACIAGGIGAGMLLQKWINKKVAEDGGVIYEFD